ncbi:MAG: ice-binding family protein [Thermoplasmata archaeon]|nr:ice-binding family protein [Thermoplasmata archaeon]
MLAKTENGWKKIASVFVIALLLLALIVVMIPWTGASPRVSTGSSRAAPTTAPARPAATCGQVPVPLGSASSYAALSGTTVTSTGATAITGDIGVSPGTSVTGFPPGTYTGTENVSNAASAAAEANATLAYNNASSRSNCAVTVAGNIGGQTLTPGLYKSTSSLAISSGDLTLSGGGNPNGVFVFQVASALTTTSGRAVILTNGAQAANVYWQVGSSVTLGTTSKMSGTLISYASITMMTGSHLNGRAMARTGDVTLSASTIVVPTGTTQPTYTVTFTESGLPGTTPWSLALNGVQGSSSSTTIIFTVGDGSYTFLVNAVTGYRASPSSGSVSVQSGPATQSINFATGSTPKFPVSFVSSGLVSGTSWGVSLNGVQKTTETGMLAFSLANGTYSYSVSGGTGYTAAPSAGTVSVDGAAVSQVIVFNSSSGAETFTVTFTESGLSAGTNWSVTLNGIPEPSSNSTLVFTELNGTNAYTVATSSGYTETPASGNVTVHGANAGQTITFTSVGGGGGSSSGTPAWLWAALALLVIGVVAAVGAALWMRRRRT